MNRTCNAVGTLNHGAPEWPPARLAGMTFLRQPQPPRRRKRPPHRCACPPAAPSSVGPARQNAANRVTADGTPFIVVTDAAAWRPSAPPWRKPPSSASTVRRPGLTPARDRVRLLSITHGHDRRRDDRLRRGLLRRGPRPVVGGAGRAAHRRPQRDLRFAVPGRPSASHQASSTTRCCCRSCCTARAGRRASTAWRRRPSGSWAALLDKTEQRSDWSGDLTPEQLAYAAADAAVLPPLFAALPPRSRPPVWSASPRSSARCLPAVAWLCRSRRRLRPGRVGCTGRRGEAEGRGTGRAARTPPPRRGRFAAWRRRLELGLPRTGQGSVRRPRRHAGQHRRRRPGRGEPPARRAGAGVPQRRPSWHRPTGRSGTPTRCTTAAFTRAGADRVRLRAHGLQDAEPPKPAPRRPLPPLLRRPARPRAGEGRLLANRTADRRQDRAASRHAGRLRPGDDLHTQTARLVLGVETPTKEQRQLAKSLNFGLLFGMGAKGLRVYALSQLRRRADRGAGRRLPRRLLRGLPRPAPLASVDRRRPAWTRERWPAAAEQASRRYTEKLEHAGSGDRGGRPQAGAGPALGAPRPSAPARSPCWSVHDEIVVECDADQADAVKAWLTRAMVDGMAPLIAPVPCEVEAKVGRTWGGD